MAAVETPVSPEYARLTEMIERSPRSKRRPQSRSASRSRRRRARTRAAVWLVAATDRTAIAPTIAQVAFAGGGRRGAERIKNLQGLAGQALAFVNPAVSGIATTLGSLFRPDEERTAVWALAATHELARARFHSCLRDRLRAYPRRRSRALSARDRPARADQRQLSPRRRRRNGRLEHGCAAERADHRGGRRHGEHAASAADNIESRRNRRSAPANSRSCCGLYLRASARAGATPRHRSASSSAAARARSCI